MKCFECKHSGLIPHEGYPNINVLIDPQTGQPHKCDPAEKIVKTGKWQGWTFGDMAKLWDSQRVKAKNDLEKIKQTSSNV